MVSGGFEVLLVVNLMLVILKDNLVSDLQEFLVFGLKKVLIRLVFVVFAEVKPLLQQFQVAVPLGNLVVVDF